jgi:hypothetical protein
MNAPHKIAIARIVALVVTLALMPLAISMTMTAIRISGRFAQWQKDRPVDVAVDLSKTGTTTAPFHQTCQSAHGESIFLNVEGLDLKTPGALNGLAGKVSIVCDAETVVASDLADAVSVDAGPQNRAQLAWYFPFSNGDYTLVLQVDKPAPQLAGHPQRLSAQYFLCGMEKVPELLEKFMSIGLWLLVLLIGVPAIINLCRFGWRKKA